MWFEPKGGRRTRTDRRIETFGNGDSTSFERFAKMNYAEEMRRLIDERYEETIRAIDVFEQFLGSKKSPQWLGKNIR